MVNFNWWVIFVAALIPLLTGSIWYSKALFYNTLKRLDNRQQDLKHSPLIFILTYVLGILLAFGLVPITIHQFHILSVFANDPAAKQPGSELYQYIQDFFTQYGSNFRTFKHGAFHGALSGIFVALPIISITSMFEGKGFKYIAIHAGYWILNMALMGGLICAFI